jgi:hypothetical protein
MKPSSVVVWDTGHGIYASIDYKATKPDGFVLRIGGRETGPFEFLSDAMHELASQIEETERTRPTIP